MAERRALIAITPESLVDDEGRKVEALLRAGWHRVHLRHPGATRVEMRALIESIGQRYHDRLVLHGHFDLTNDFNLGGLHLNRRCPVPPPLYHGSLSRSCHSVDEVLDATGMQYVTLSPIFDSISKSGYRSAFTPAELMRLDSAQIPVIALGGIDSEHIQLLKVYKFSGYAMLGSIPWNGTADEVSAFADAMEKSID